MFGGYRNRPSVTETPATKLMGTLYRGHRNKVEGMTLSTETGTEDVPLGFVVGGLVPELKVYSDADTAELYSELSGWLAQYRDRVPYIGSWLNTETGIVHYDAVEIYDDIETAMAKARERNELAIYDMVLGQEYRVS